MATNITVLAIDKFAKSITLGDTSSPVTTAATIRWRYWTDTAFQPDVILSGAQITAIKSVGGLALTPDLVGLTATIGASFADGIHVVQVVVDAGTQELKILVNKSAEACIVSAIGKLSEKNCDCSDCEAALQKLIRWRFAADIKRDLADYDAAHNLVVSIGKYCVDCDSCL
jgi:hypothetical protein